MGDKAKWRELMDKEDQSFWMSRKQYLMSLNKEDMDLVEFLVWQAYELGKKNGTPAPTSAERETYDEQQYLRDEVDTLTAKLADRITELEAQRDELLGFLQGVRQCMFEDSSFKAFTLLEVAIAKCEDKP